MGSAPIDIRDRAPYPPEQFRVDHAHHVDHVLVSGGEIRDRIGRLAVEVSDDYRDRADDFYPVCVLKGAMRFFGALTSQLNLSTPFEQGVVRTSRYADGQAGEAEATVDLLSPDAVQDAHVLVVEDLIDEGYTLKTLCEQIESCDPASLAVIVLFDKIDRRAVDVTVDYTGFTIPDEFVVGYGIDYDERYRDLDHLAVLTDSVMSD